MPNVISRLHDAVELWSFKYNCYEAVHPWTPFCSASALEVGAIVFGEAIKLYTPLYLFSQFAQRRFDRESFKNTAQSVLRSTTFISANAFFALLFFCSSQYLTKGKFYYYAVAYIPGFLASSMAVLIEKPNRRSSLAFYVANVASEALFRIYVGRGYLTPINNGQVYLFALSIAAIMLLAKKHGFEDDPLSAVIKTIVGPEEAGARRRNSSRKSIDDKPLPPVENRLNEIAECEQKTGALSVASNNQGLSWIQRWISMGPRHQLCPHRNSSCVAYTAKTMARALLIGYGAQLGLKLLTRAPSIVKNPSLLWTIPTDNGLLRLGAFLATFSGVYKATNCALRWTRNSCEPSNNFVAGLLAGPALLIYPSPTVALYVTWKCLEALFNEAVRNEWIKHKDLFIVALYGLATSQLFYSALMDPRYMKKSYMAFLDRMSRHKLHMVNRSVLDVFGTEASSGYEDFFPDLHPKFMSRAFLGSIWIWMIEQKMVAKTL